MASMDKMFINLEFNYMKNALKRCGLLHKDRATSLLPNKLFVHSMERFTSVLEKNEIALVDNKFQDLSIPVEEDKRLRVNQAVFFNNDCLLSFWKY